MGYLGKVFAYELWHQAISMEVKKDKTPFRLVIPEKNLTISHTSAPNCQVFIGVGVILSRLIVSMFTNLKRV